MGSAAVLEQASNPERYCGERSRHSPGRLVAALLDVASGYASAARSSCARLGARARSPRHAHGVRDLLFAALIALAPALAARAAEPQKPAAPAQKPAAPAQAPAAKPAAPADTDKALYGLGLAIATSLEVFSLSPAELDTVVKGVRDGFAGKPRFQLDAKTQAAVNDLARARAPKAAEKAATREKEQGAPYLARMAKENGAKKSPSGAIVIPIKEGTGPSPTATDKVKVNYTGTLVSGRVFDSSAQRGPAEFALNQVIKCWSEGLQMMKVGGKAKIVCPSEIAYGPNGNAPVIPGNAVLTFEVELLEIPK